MKEPEIYDFADEEIVELELAPAIVVADNQNDYFNILQDLQSSLTDTVAEDAAPLTFDQSANSSDSNPQISFNKNSSSDFESLVELPPTFQPDETQTPSQNGGEFDFAETDNAAFSQQFQEFLEEIENNPETGEAFGEELPEVPAFFGFDVSSSSPHSAAEPPVEEFVADAEIASIVQDLITMEATEEDVLETADGAAADRSFVNDVSLAAANADEFEEPDAPEMLSAEILEFKTEGEATEFLQEESAFAIADAEADHFPEPPTFLFSKEENSVAVETDEPDFPSQLEPYREGSAQILNQYIVFSLDENFFAFPATSIDEIGHPLPVTGLPFVPEWFSGVANLRGDIIAVLDLRRLWQKPAAISETRTKMLVVRSERENLRVGLLVDGVSEMLPLAAEEIKPSDDFSASPFAAYLSGVSRANGQPLLMLNPEQFLTSPEIRQL